MTASVICIVDTEARAAELVDELKKAGFQSADISTLFTDPARAEGAREQPTEPGNPSGPSPLTVGVAGTMGWLTGAGSPGVPGSGPTIGDGPMAPALSGPLLGLGENSVVRAITDRGVPVEQAKRYEKMLREGNVLVAVHSEKPEELARAREVFRGCGAGSIFPSAETEASSAGG